MNRSCFYQFLKTKIKHIKFFYKNHKKNEHDIIFSLSPRSNTNIKKKSLNMIFL